MSLLTAVTADVTGQLVFLGTGTSVGVPVLGCGCSTCRSDDPRDKRMRCGLVLGLPGGNLLVDTPPDLRSQLLREGIGVIHATVFTHSHADHLFGLDDLRVFPHYLGGPVPIYCEAEVDARIRKSYDYAFLPVVNEGAGGVPQLDLRPITTEPFTVLGQRIIPIRLEHGKLRVLGFRIGNVAYCTDTSAIPPESQKLLQGLDVLILGALRHRPHPTHFTLSDAVEMATKLGARRTLFTHMGHDLAHAATNALLPAGMELAYDGLRIPLT